MCRSISDISILDSIQFFPNYLITMTAHIPGGDGEGESSEAPSLLSYTRRYVSLGELDHVCQFGLREPIHLCPSVIEEGGEGSGERGGWGRGGCGLKTAKIQNRHSPKTSCNKLA